MHHSGLLPILKELVELLFQTQLVKVLMRCYRCQRSYAGFLMHRVSYAHIAAAVFLNGHARFVVSVIDLN